MLNSVSFKLIGPSLLVTFLIQFQYHLEAVIPLCQLSLVKSRIFTVRLKHWEAEEKPTWCSYRANCSKRAIQVFLVALSQISLDKFVQVTQFPCQAII